MPPPGPTSPHEYARPVAQFELLLPPSSAGESVGDATGLAGASVGATVGVTGSAEEVGPVEAADDAAADADDDAEAVAAFCTAPDEPVVDEHPATAAVTSTTPTVSSFIRVLIEFSILERWGCESSSHLFDGP